MTAALRYLLTTLVGAALGIGLAVQTVRAGAFASTVQIGPWATGRDFGTADASARTRAVVALSGLLALPAREARYYTASMDDAGRPLDGRCTYRVAGGKLPGRWWSLTLYDRDGYLAGPGPWSAEGAAVARAQAEADRLRAGLPLGSVAYPELGPYGWHLTIGPRAKGVLALPTAGAGRFQLTLRLYLPDDGGHGDPPRDVLPTIAREAC